MKLSYNWLNSYLDIPFSPAELARRLTMAGLEVEKMEYLGQGLEYIVVGRIEKVEEHPGADGLHVCQVDFAGEERQIVCGADNVRPGLKVPVALPGIEIPAGEKVEEKRIEGVRSQGMICSEDELGLTDEKKDVIMELPDNYRAGSKFISEAGRDDFVYKLDLTPNYARCLGLLGIAREIKALTEEEIEINWPETSIDFRGESPVSIEVEDKELCPRYTARLIENVEIKPSPDWLQERLRAVGVRPINNVVDITNYVMLEYNQPLHAFDFAEIAGGSIFVRRAEKDEELTTLDDERRELDEEDLVIADAEKAIGLAGVMGGAGTEVSRHTDTVLLEAAFFDPVSIRRTSRRHGLNTESSHRFEREVDISAVDEASRRACHLLEKYASAEIVGGISEYYPRTYEPAEIEVGVERINSLLGTGISGEKMKNMLTDLGFSCQLKSGELAVSVPGFRSDVEYDADIMEEIARAYGYNNIDYSRPATTEPGGRTPEQKARLKLNNLLKGLGLEEAYCFSLRAGDDEFLPYLKEGESERPRLKNPLSNNFAELRTTLLPGLIESLSGNARNQVEEMAVYELGTVFSRLSDDKRPAERQKMGLASMGADSGLDRWEQEAADFFYLKGVIENVFADFVVDEYAWKEGDHPLFHPGRCALIEIAGEKAGYLGELHPDITAEFDLPERAAAGELSTASLFAAADYREIEYTPLSRYPSMIRDLAVVVEEDISSRTVRETIGNAAGDKLRNVEIFDFYQGDQIPAGRKSLAFQLIFQDRERTLTEEEVNEEMEQIFKALTEKLGAEIRGK